MNITWLTIPMGGWRQTRPLRSLGVALGITNTNTSYWSERDLNLQPADLKDSALATQPPCFPFDHSKVNLMLGWLLRQQNTTQSDPQELDTASTFFAPPFFARFSSPPPPPPQASCTSSLFRVRWVILDIRWPISYYVHGTTLFLLGQIAFFDKLYVKKKTSSYSRKFDCSLYF